MFMNLTCNFEVPELFSVVQVYLGGPAQAYRYSGLTGTRRAGDAAFQRAQTPYTKTDVSESLADMSAA